MERLIVWLIVLFLFFILPNILQAMAKRRAEQARRQAGPEGEEPAEDEAAEGEQVHVAGPDDIARYLESLGIKVERPAPPPPRRPAPPLPAPKPEPKPAVPAAAYRGPGVTAPPTAGPAIQVPPPKPPRRARPAPTHAVLPAQAPETTQEPGPPAQAEPVALPTAPLPIPVLGGRPTAADLRRGIVLAEILRRPDLERLPCDRDLL
ncbi:MAG TPA: hypothetical protein PLE19_14965 [Planctomycetota bacterium]|nr:hypothetical protein [Planctomycetota bacterium]HRR80577.1 hypothetical protein [Planctomycetota bacterium]HRT94436.1 hypothetical protein [Planctomycetota bacterium]